jgi:hypothetical protein
MREILEFGGPEFLIPVVLFALVLYAVKGVYGLTGHRSRHRKEFLDLWDAARAQDDLWLEVIVRHHFGITIPAGIIRLALAQPDKSQSLFELRELWPLFRYNRNTQTVAWAHRWHVNPRTRRAERRIMNAAFPILLLIALGYVLAVPAMSPSIFYKWIFGFGAVTFSGCAFAAVFRHSTMTTATDVGDEWIRRINQHRQPSQPSEPAIP